MDQRFYKNSKFKNLKTKKNQALIGFIVIFIRPEAEWSNHEQVEKFKVT